MLRRPRRNRKSAVIRSLVQETTLSADDFIFPLFVTDGQNQRVEIKSMPGIYRYSLDLLLEEIHQCMQLGIRTFALFPQLSESIKDTYAKESYNPDGLYLRTIRTIKEQLPATCLMTDVAMDPYSADGHDGLVRNGEILNDETLEILGKMAIAQAKAGADMVGPSDMMDGRVGYLRQVLDDEGFTQVSIMAYTAKYASAFYGPFRDALDSAPKFGDKKTYQMDPANRREALIEADLDAQEGADILMVKPALAYLDVISLLNQHYDLPIAAYNVSGEYAMIKAAARNGWLDGERAMLECLLSIKRAGAKIILSYFAKEFAQWQQKSEPFGSAFPYNTLIHLIAAAVVNKKTKTKNGKVIQKLLLKMVRRLDRQHESLEQMVTLLATSNAGIKAEKEQTTQMLKLLEGMHGDMKKMKKKQAKTNDYLQRLEQRLSKEKPLEKKEESETEE